jgi:hypothetical protein
MVNKLRINEDAFKISFIQVVPGAENEVIAELRAKCFSSGIDNFIILLALGVFDIVFICSPPEKGFDPVLTKTGLITQLKQVNRCFCFRYSGWGVKDFYSAIKEKKYVSISLMKLVSGIPMKEIQIDKLLYSGNSDDYFTFGSIGWNDVILIMTGNDLVSIINKTLTRSCDGSNVKKSYSIIATLPATDSDLDVLPIPPELSVEIMISVSPLRPILFSKDRNYDVISISGKHDFLAVPPKGISFKDLLSDIIAFRQNNVPIVYSTYTRFGLTNSNFASINDNTNTHEAYCYDDYCVIDESTLSYKDVSEIFNDSSALIVALTCNHLNNLFNNRVINDAFWDMRKYPSYVKKQGAELSEIAGRDIAITFAYNSSDLIRQGAEFRLFGTHGSIEDTVGQFTKYRGGAQKALLAIECIIDAILKAVSNNEMEWEGFVVPGGREFYVINEVIRVPYNVLWKPHTWWPIYHEIGHMIINVWEDVLRRDLPEIKVFLGRKRLHDNWFNIINEFAAETVGYKIGYGGDYSLYIYNAWKYLSQLSPDHDNISEYSVYVIRTFFVKIYDKLEKGEYNLDDLLNWDIIYDDLVKHFNYIGQTFFEDRYTSLNCFKMSRFIAALNTPIFSELYSWIKHRLQPGIEQQIHINPKTRGNSVEVISSLSEGKPWGDIVTDPDQVFSLYLKKKSHSFAESMAFIATFSAQYAIK